MNLCMSYSKNENIYETNKHSELQILKKLSKKDLNKKRSYK